MEVQLRAVERAVACVDGKALAHLGDSRAQRILRETPVLLVADVIVRHGRQLDGVGQAERRIDLVEELDDILNFVLHLIPCHEDVRVVLREAAHTEQAVQRAGELMAVDQTELTDSERQVAVGVRLARVDHHAARAVHGLDGVVLAVDDGGVHVLLVVVPVTRALPQAAVEDHRGRNFDIAVALMHLAPIVDQRVLEHHALRQEEREAGALLSQHEEPKLLAELAVVALLGLFDSGKILVELLFFREGHAVDSLERLAVGVAAPVGRVAGRQLDGVALDAAGRVEVRAGAEIGKLALRVERDVRVKRKIVDELDLVGLVLLFHILDGFLARQLKALKLQLFLADLAHLRLELFHDLRRKGKRRVEVIIEAVVDRRADGQLDLRMQPLDGLRQNVRTGVPVGFAIGLVFKREFIVFCHGFCLLPISLG